MEIAKFYDAAGADCISVTGYGYGPVPMQFALDYWMYPSPDEDMKQFLDRLDGEGLSIPPLPPSSRPCRLRCSARLRNA